MQIAIRSEILSGSPPRCRLKQICVTRGCLETPQRQQRPPVRRWKYSFRWNASEFDGRVKDQMGAGLQNLPGFFAKARGTRTQNERQFIVDLEQLYGYINNRNGILSNWPCTWAVRRVEADSNDKTLEYADPFTLGELPSLLKTCQK